MSSSDTNIGGGRSGFDSTTSKVNPDDVEGLKQSVNAAVPRDRNRARERTPNAALNNSGKYPLRTVQEYIGGHRTVFDNTPGARIVEMAHGSGTFQQWSEDGTEIKVVVGNAHHHMKEGYTLTINQNGDIKIDGHCRVSVGGGVHIEAKGDVSLISSGNITTFTPKNYNIVAGGKVNILGRGGVNISSDNSIKVRAEKDHIMKIGKNAIAEIGEYSLTQVQGPHDTYAKGSIGVTTDASSSTKIAGSNYVKSASAVEEVGGNKLTNAGTMQFNANRIDLN